MDTLGDVDNKRNSIPGGGAPNLDFDPKELAKDTQPGMGHTNNPDLANDLPKDPPNQPKKKVLSSSDVLAIYSM
jgi:hypothetical protein